MRETIGKERQTDRERKKTDRQKGGNKKTE